MPPSDTPPWLSSWKQNPHRRWFWPQHALGGGLQPPPRTAGVAPSQQSLLRRRRQFLQLPGADPFQRYMEEAEGLHREHVEAGGAVDEALGDGHLADGGRAKHWERTRADGGDG